MGLNDIQLPGSVIVSLYARSLVAPEGIGAGETIIEKSPASAIPPVQKISPELSSLGSNKQNILIVVDHDTVTHMPDEELAFLTKMLSACKLDLGDVAIVNIHQQKSTSKELLATFKSRIVFLFGIDPISFGLPVSFPQYQVQNVAGTTYLYAPALAERHKDELLKSKLWVSLKRIFGM